MTERPYVGLRICALALASYIPLLGPAQLNAQEPLERIMELAANNSSRVKMAQDDVQHAMAGLRESRDYYIPTLGLSGGLGKTYGISLTVPTIFTVTSQSLVYSASQRDYIRAARSNLQAAELTLRDVRQQAEEDAALTCISLTEAIRRREILAQEVLLAAQISAVSQRREAAGLESSLEDKKSRRAALQISMQQPSVDSEIAALKEHLRALTGSESDVFTGDPEALLHLAPPTNERNMDSLHSDNDATLSSLAAARAKAQQARGDAHSALRPQVLMESQYGRISPINNVQDYYNLQGHYNVALFGIAVQFPLFDRVRAAKASEAAADAAHAQHEAESATSRQREGWLRMQSSVVELERKSELAQLDREIANAQLMAIVKEVSTSSADITGRQMNPMDELYARMDVQQKYLDWLGSLGALRRAQISLLRQNGELDDWAAKLSKPALPVHSEGLSK